MIPAGKIFKTKYLSAQLGCARLSFATPEQMAELMHLLPGSASPMGLMNDSGRKVRLVIDRELMSLDYFGCHPCANTSTIKMRMYDFLEKFLPAIGHDCTVVELASDTKTL